MQIKADKKGAEAVRQLCDVALRSGGLANLAPITQVLACLDHPDKPKPEDEKNPKKRGT
jgi:hypothetical protein